MSQRYTLLLTGKTLPGHRRETVAVALGKVLRLSTPRALLLLCGSEQFVKHDLEAAEMVRCIAVLRAAGAETLVVPGATAGSAISDADTIAQIRAIESLAGSEVLVSCPCCGMKTLKLRGVGEECTVCHWLDFPEQGEDHPRTVVPGRNHDLNLKQAREDFEIYGSLDPADYKLPPRLKGPSLSLVIPAAAYSAYSLSQGQRFFPDEGIGSLVYIAEAWLLAGILLSGLARVFIPIIDHYDQRRNEGLYRKLAFICLHLFYAFMWFYATAVCYRITNKIGTVVSMTLIGLVIMAVVLGIRVLSKRYGVVWKVDL